MGKAGILAVVMGFTFALLAFLLVLPAVPASAVRLTTRSLESHTLSTASVEDTIVHVTGVFRVDRKPTIAKAKVVVPDQGYTGKALAPAPKVTLNGKTLKAGTDYSVTYRNNVNKGTATVIVTGKGGYVGKATGTFKIVARTGISKTVVLALDNQSYTGAAITPTPKVMMGSTVLKKGTDYTLAYRNNVDVGTATMTITGKNLYSGTTSVPFEIAPASISSAIISDIPDQTFTGAALTPKPTVMLGERTLVEGTDYTLSYENNVPGGRATVVVTGIGNYSGSIEAGFNIVVPTIGGISVFEIPDTGEAALRISRIQFNKTFSYGDSLDVEFSNGYTLSNIPYYNGWFAKQGTPLVISYSDELDPRVATNHGERMWTLAGLSNGDTVTIRLAGRGTYSAVQNALSFKYSDNRADYPSDVAFANFRQVTGGALSGNLYRSASPVNNWRKRAACACALAQSADIAFVLNLSDSSAEIRFYLNGNNSNGVDTSFYEGLFNAGKVLPLDMGSAYSTEEYRTKVVAGFSGMAHRDGPYLIHCIEGKDRTGFACLLLAALAGATYDEMLADYMVTYANYCGVTLGGTPDKYQAIQSVCFDSMIGFLMDETDTAGNDYEAAARTYLLSGGMAADDIDLLVSKLTS